MAYTAYTSGITVTTSFVTILASLPLIFIFTWLSTSASYRRTVSQFTTSNISQKHNGAQITHKPARLPYSIPWLGSALSFLNQTPGSFWRYYLEKVAPNSHGATTLLLGGDVVHVISSPSAIQTAFKSKNMSRDPFTRKIMIQGLSVSKEDAFKGVPLNPPPKLPGTLDMDKILHEHLLNPGAVNVMMIKYVELFGKRLQTDEALNSGTELVLYDWFKDIMFQSSTEALMGTKILEMNPRLAEQYWIYDHGMLTRFYGLPRFWFPEPYKALDDLSEVFVRWHELLSQSKPDMQEEWNPLHGSRIVRYRHQLYEEQGLSVHGKAGFDLGLLFGFSSNSIAISGWLLFHLLSPTTPADVLPRVLAELETARRKGRDIDVNTLTALPLFNSVVNETLRVYVDTLVTRELSSPHHLGRYSYENKDIIMMPTYLAHYDEEFWSEQTNQPSAKEWYAERFLRQDESGKDVCSLTGTAGNFFPFGGGQQICPGRLFAKHEVLASVAILLLEYDIEFVEFVDCDSKGRIVSRGRDAAGFPYVKRQYAGNGAVLMGGDMKIKIKRKT